MPKRVFSLLMTTDAVGGVWRYSLDLCGELARSGAELTLVCLGPAPSAEQRAQAAHVPELKLLEYPEPLEWMDDPWQGVERSGGYLQALAREVRADIVHLNGFSHGALSFGAPTLVVGHSCVLSWWAAVHGGPAPARYATYRRMVTQGLRGASAVVAPSRAMLGSLWRHYGLRGGQVIYNGSPRPSSSAPVAKEPIVLSAGRLWDAAKNLSTLAAAAHGASWPVYVAGTGDVPASVIPLGQLSPGELASWMKRASVYALPARYEPFGLSALEAALHGAALVLGDIPSLREVWGDAATYVTPSDRLGLRRAVDRLLEDSDERSASSQRAMQRAQRYTIEEQARRYRLLYLRLLAAGGSIGAARRAVSSRVRGFGEVHES